MSRPGRATSFDIAELAGVSQPTVSRALRGDRTVSKATRVRIEAIARELNYTVDRNASSLRRGRANTLALLFFDDPLPDRSLINPFFLSMLGSILRACAEHGYDLLTSFQRMTTDWQADFEAGRKADGIILLGHGDFQEYRGRLSALAEAGVQFVRWGSIDRQGPGVTIGCDNHAGGMAAGRHLVAIGRRRIVFLGTASASHPEFLDRHAGLADALTEAGAPPPRQVDAISTEEAGAAAVERLLADGDGFDAVFAASDLIAIGAIRALRDGGRAVPGDVAVIGFDDIPAASINHPPLSTVAQDYVRAGEALVGTLIRSIEGQPAEPVLLPPALVLRGSA